MKAKTLIISLIALLIINNVAAYGIEYSYDNNQLRCFEDWPSGTEETGTWTMYATSNNAVIGTPTQIGFVPGQTGLSIFNAVDISNIECNAVMTCVSTIMINGQIEYAERRDIIKECQTITTSTLTNTTYDFGTLPNGTGGNMTGLGNLSALPPKILGLEKSKVFMLLSVLIMIICMTGIKPIPLGIAVSCIGMCILIMIIQWFTLPGSLIMFICIIGAIYFFSKQ